MTKETRELSLEEMLSLAGRIENWKIDDHYSNLCGNITGNVDRIKITLERGPNNKGTDISYRIFVVYDDGSMNGIVIGNCRQEIGTRIKKVYSTLLTSVREKRAAEADKRVIDSIKYARKMLCPS